MTHACASCFTRAGYKAQESVADGSWRREASTIASLPPPESGRPLSARNAWGALAILAGCRPAGLSDSERSRLHKRLRHLAAYGDVPTGRLQKLLAARAEVRRYRVHRSVLQPLLDDADVVRGGASAAPRVGADYVAPGRVELYVHPERIGKLEAGFGLVLDARGGNLLVRIPPASAWPFLVSAQQETGDGRDAPASVIAADLLDTKEDRALVAAAGILKPLLASSAASTAEAA
ncbi:type IV toxin-antitoxin system AbiEi family antitoxin [Streptomyces cyaneofuscatus]|uniref:type IV toxin-antitoxin system AbiEi family antitoxin n=1 Tax=Streptomyces cyaneofuscatus TaxID=66883 RepID=UPI00381A4506